MFGLFGIQLRRDTHLSDWAIYTQYNYKLTVVLLAVYIQHRLDFKIKDNVCRLYFKLICQHWMTFFMVSSDKPMRMILTHWFSHQFSTCVPIFTTGDSDYDCSNHLRKYLTTKIKTFRTICLFESEYFSSIQIPQ